MALTEKQEHQANHLANLIKIAKGVTVLTGAGISTESGLPDFRSEDGLWSKYDPYEAGSLKAFRKNPSFVWEYYYDRLKAENPDPNDGHLAVAAWSARPNWKGLITQNVDGLHQKAGSDHVVEVHGNLTRCVCVGHRHEVSMADALRDRQGREDGVPRCPQCNSRLKPDIVLFGEQLPQKAIARAYDYCQTSDLVICLGSSLQVAPVSHLPYLAATNGADVVIITQGETPYDQGFSDPRKPWRQSAQLALRSDAPLGEFLMSVNQYF